MKIKPEDYQRMKTAVLAVVSKNPEAYNHYKNQGLSDMRYNWDVLRASGFDTCSLYSYLNDDHINTALKGILGNSGLNSKGNSK